MLAQVRLEARHPPPDGDQATSPAVHEGWLLQPTRTAIFQVDPDTLRAQEVLSHPWFHDVHGIAPGPRGWLIPCTGHETVVEMALDGRILDHLHLGPPIDASRDHRGLPHDAFKPHGTHPNRAFLLHGRRWITTLTPGGCRAWDGEGRIEVGGLAHDGVLREGRLWFTRTDGLVVAVDPESLETVDRLDVAALEGGPGAPGWCRAVEVVGDRVFVGFTQLRASRWREGARRLLKGPKKPSRIVELDRARRRVVRVLPLGPSGVIHGITAWPPVDRPRGRAPSMGPPAMDRPA